MHGHRAARRNHPTGIHRRVQHSGPLAAATPPRPPRPAAQVAATSTTPTVPQVASWITGLPARLGPAEATRLNGIRARCPELDAAFRHVAAFARMIKNRSGDRDRLTAWIVAVEADNLVALRSFTAGLRRECRSNQSLSRNGSR